MDHSHVTAEEDKQYRALQNQLIEIEMGAKDALRMLKEELIKWLFSDEIINTFLNKFMDIFRFKQQ